jgi:spore coat protein SA
MIYHLLDEPFSAYTGLAISSIVANIMRLEGNTVAVCPEADGTWGFSADRVLVIPELSLLFKRLGWRVFPGWLRRSLICYLFRALISRLKPGDIVWCFNWPYVAWALEPKVHAKGAKLVYHAQNSIAQFEKDPVFRSLTADAIVFNSEAMRQEGLKVFPQLKNTCTIYNGADEARFYPLPAGNPRDHSVPVVLYVGRLVQQKGVHVLIEAVRILNERNIQVVCKLVGSSHAGGPKSQTTPYVQSLHERCPSNVQFEGFRSGTDIAPVYRSADISCCPSIWQEPFGNVNIEAMACGVPVVASRVGGIPEIASEGGILLVEPNSPVELADALQTLILDEDLRAKTGAKGLSSFKRRFTWSEIVRQHRELVKSL